uniref:Proteasome assembly chaperone 3 n=1 Tax=Plectus sambesii TaxID=2011161 RepID=A0A914WGE4_9BILA
MQQMATSSTRAFVFEVDNERYSAQVTALGHCFLVWIGQKRAVDSTAFGFSSDASVDRSSSMLVFGQRDAKAHLLEKFTGLLSKKLPNKQVIVSTDLTTEAAEKWQHIERAVIKDIEENRAFYM